MARAPTEGAGHGEAHRRAVRTGFSRRKAAAERRTAWPSGLRTRRQRRRGSARWLAATGAAVAAAERRVTALGR
uniref:Uncharacterized protein n=1 Tax=Oryza sativa subsp. japonica TaxID=39947 RepID=Q6K5M7_ORYSJ|nr:hypothetical protein [Oryza sativa Japonica Group]